MPDNVDDEKIIDDGSYSITIPSTVTKPLKFSLLLTQKSKCVNSNFITNKYQ